MKWDKDGRICSVCKKYKSWDSFSDKKAKRYKTSLQTHQIKQPKCKECAKKEVREWREAQSPERLKHLYLTNTYGISYTDYLYILKEQNNCCKICNRKLNTTIEVRQLQSNSAVVDHCHISGKVRGILCNECNRGLGYFHDNKESLMNAAQYLTETESSEGGQ